jgi:DNA polymerase-3 subunit epsilon
MRQIFLDTETTGLLPEQGDRVIEIGCVELFNRKLTGKTLHLYLNPDRESHEDALRIHGITSEFLKDKPRFAEVVDEFLEFVSDAQLIIHNAPFDLGFLNIELSLLGRPPLSEYVSGVLDTLVLAKAMFPGKRNSLDALCSRLEVDNSGRSLHGALLDAELLADVYINMTRGQDALLIESSVPDETDVAAVHCDLNALDFVVIRASDPELAAHAMVLTELDKSSGAKTTWRIRD